MSEATSRAGVMAAAIALSVAGLVGVLLWASASTGRPPVAAPRPGSSHPATRPAAAEPPPVAQPAPRHARDWTHREILAHLQQQGLDLEAAATGIGADKGPAMFWGLGLSDVERAALHQNADKPDAPTRLRGWPVVYVQKCATAEAARDDAGAMTSAFSWGRFLFLGNEDVLAAIRPRLP
jgi:hypothetical protein